MKKILLMLVLLLAVACGGPEAPASETTDSSESEVPTTVAEDAAPEDTSADVAQQPSSPDSDDFTPASTPAEAGEVRDFDHAKGATDPAVTIIEYGDYQ